LVDDYRALQRRIGTTRNVVVQPSTYGTDNRCHLDALAAFGSTARIGRGRQRRRVNRGAQAHARARCPRHPLQLAQAGATTPEMIEPLSKRINDLGWHIQVNAPAGKLMEIMPILERVPSSIVFDHLAHIPQPDGVDHSALRQGPRPAGQGPHVGQAVRRLRRYQGGTTDLRDSSAVARAYATAAPERCVWGSDWPHPTEQQETVAGRRRAL